MDRNELYNKMFELNELEKDNLLKLAFKLFQGQEADNLDEQEFSESAIFFKGVENAIKFK